MTHYNTIAENPESTVVANYQPEKNERATSYQSEADLEKAFIKQLQAQAYEYIQINSEDELIDNLRKQLEKLNNIQFTNSEWKQFFSTKIANNANKIVEKTAIIQEDYIQILRRNDGSEINIYLIDKSDIHYNCGEIRKSLRRYNPCKRIAPCSRRIKAKRRWHKGGVQPNKPL